MQIWHTPKWFFGKCSFSSGQLSWAAQRTSGIVVCTGSVLSLGLVYVDVGQFTRIFPPYFSSVTPYFSLNTSYFSTYIRYRIFPNIHRIFPRIHRIFLQFTLLIARRKLFWLRWASLPASPCPSPSSPSRPSGTSPPVEVSIGTQLPGIVIQL